MAVFCEVWIAIVSTLLFLLIILVLLLFTRYLVTVTVYDVIAFLLGLILFLVLPFLPLKIRNRE